MNAFTVGTPVLVALVATALLFDFLNGLHDSANSIATVVATRVLRPFTAVLWASFFNFIAFTVFGLHVAATMGNGVVNAGLVDPLVVFGALTGAIVWNILTWWLGIPSSSSHALVGGLIGAGMAKAGPLAIVWGGGRGHRFGHCAVPVDRISPCHDPRAGDIMAGGTNRPRLPSIGDFESFSSCRPPFSASHMAATMPRRQWGSSPCCSTRRGF